MSRPSHSSAKADPSFTAKSRSTWEIVRRVSVYLKPYKLLALGTMGFALLSLLSFSNVSFAVPATAMSYILETLLAKYILKEQVKWRRWAAVTLVAGGVVMLSL